MTSWRALAGVAAALVVLGACGGGGTSPAKAVHDAGAATLARKTVALAVTVDNPSVAAKPSTGTGTYDLVSDRGHLDPLTLYGVPGVPDGSSAEAILQLPVVYAHLLGSAANALPIKTPWVKIDLRVLANIPGLDLGTIAAAQSINPRQFLLFLAGAAAPARTIGTETVAGTSTTHYEVSCDLNQAVKGLSGDDATALNRAIASYESPTVPTDVWVDNAGLVRRMGFRLSIKNAGSKAPTSEQVQFDFTGFGVVVNATAPPASQTTDLAGLLGAIAGG